MQTDDTPYPGMAVGRLSLSDSVAIVKQPVNEHAAACPGLKKLSGSQRRWRRLPPN
jgi:hypothetical protein